MTQYSPQYIEHLMQGPFPGQVDPWAEAGRYFQQLHAGMIDRIAEQLHAELLPRGYFVSRETSLQISGLQREPDIFIRRDPPQHSTMRADAYTAAAQALMAEAGDEVTDEPELTALHFHALDTGSLVTVLEIISPSNKGVNFVEIDSTCLLTRMLASQLTAIVAYHIAIYLPEEKPRVMGIGFGQPLKSFAVPLQADVLKVDTQSAYDTVYQRYTVAKQIEHEGRYTLDNLPFPSTLTVSQQQTAVRQARVWIEQLNALRP